METTAIINTINTSTTTAAALKLRTVEIDPATGEAGAILDGIESPLIAANINALAIELLAESCRQQKPLEINDIGERFEVSDAERVLKALRGFYTTQGFDFISYFASTNFWGGEPEVCEIMEEICHRETPLWSQWQTGRLGYIALDRDKGTLVSVAPRRIARDESRATTTAARVAPCAFLHSLLRDLVNFGAEATWLEDSVRIEWAALEGNPIKPGKLLRKIIPGMPENWYVTKSEELANRIKQKFSLCEQIKVSSDLEKIYNLGGRFVSCMKGKGELYRGVVSAFPDVEIAYLCDPEDGRLLGRAILWPDVHFSDDLSISLMDRIYAENELIRQSFRQYAKSEGYWWKTEDSHSCSHCTDGHKIISLSSAAYINAAYEFGPGSWPDGAPYLDTFSEIDISDNRIFCFASPGQISCRETDGTAGWLTSPPVCNICGLEIYDDFQSFGDNIYCESCAENLKECIHCGCTVHPRQGGIHTEQGFLCPSCEDEGRWCESCESYFYGVDMTDIEAHDIVGEICPECLHKLEKKYEFRECAERSCRTLILPDSPGGMCKYHSSTLGHVCAECGEWTPTEKAAQFGTFWFCPNCVKLLLENTPLSVGFLCTNCDQFHKGKPAAICGHVVLCKECLALDQAPDDYRPPRIITTAPPAESPDSGLAHALQVWCRRAKDAPTPNKICYIFAQLNGRILTDCNGDRERHKRVFFSLCDILKNLFSQSVPLTQSPYSSTILWTQYITQDLSVKINLTYNQGTGSTFVSAYPV